MHYINTKKDERALALTQPLKQTTKMDKLTEYDKHRKWLIEVTEEQLNCIIDCVEDINRFLAGDTRLDHATSFIGDTKSMWCVRDILDTAHPYVTPDIPQNANYGWNGGNCPDEAQRHQIALGYGIYRNLRHCIERHYQRKDWSVYQSPTLTCGVPLATCRPKDAEDEE